MLINNLAFFKILAQIGAYDYEHVWKINSWIINFGWWSRSSVSKVSAYQRTENEDELGLMNSETTINNVHLKFHDESADDFLRAQKQFSNIAQTRA